MDDGGRRTVPTASVIIAAFGRASALRRALRSALGQTVPDLEVLVVCDHERDEFIRDIPREDDRVRVLNLDRRSGGQYGPNSIGLLRARGEFIAFLNHDDVWLEDHLERSLAVIRSSGSDLHQGTAAFIEPRRQDVARFGRLILGPLSSPMQPSWIALTQHLLEPVSAWVARREFARSVGTWRPALRGFDVPSLREWLARATRSGVRPSHDATPSVIKVNLHHAHSGPKYAQESDLHRLIEPLLATPPDEVRARIAEDIEELNSRGRWTHRGQSGSIPTRDRLVASARAVVYRRTGDARWLGPRPRRHEPPAIVAVRRRTGEAGVVPPHVDDLVVTEIGR